MGLAFWIASKSKDPNTQCGAVIIDSNNRPRGWGYNGPPEQIPDSSIDWSRPAKYKLMVHAEINAIRHAAGDLKGSTMYITGTPCSACMLSIATAHISKVEYYPFKSDSESMLSDNEDWERAFEIARLSNIEIVQFDKDLMWIEDRAKEIIQIIK
jgi:dCMP deaminase